MSTSIAQQLATDASATSKMTNIEYSPECVCEMLFHVVMDHIRAHRCEWYDNYTRVLVWADTDHTTLPKDFWVWTFEYGIVLNATAFETISKLFRNVGFKVVSCGYNSEDALPNKMTTFILEVIPSEPVTSE